MRALVLDRYGSVDAFRVETVPTPEPGQGQVRVRVHAASINSWDWEIARGDFLARLSSPLTPAHRILGGDIAGTIDALGEGVDGLAIGDAVFGDITGLNWGGFAEFAIAKADGLQLKPDHLDFVTASTLPQAGALALEAVDQHPLSPGSDVLVIGGGGGVGTFAIQIAKARGARVAAIDTRHKASAMERAGADFVLGRETTDIRCHISRYDLVIDPVVCNGLRANLGLLKPGGTYAVIGGRTGALLQTGLLGPFIAPRVGKKAGLVIWRQNDAGELAELADLVKAGTVTPAVDRIFTLENGVAAFRHFVAGQAHGKVVIAPHNG